MVKRRSYSNEFRKHAADLVIEQGYTFSEACMAVGVSRSALTIWVDKFKNNPKNIMNKSIVSYNEQTKIEKLEKEIIRIKWENDILRKATVLLISDQCNL